VTHSPFRPQGTILRRVLHTSACLGRAWSHPLAVMRLLQRCLREAFNSIFKVEMVRNNGSWLGIDDLESAGPSTSTGTATDAYTAISA